MSRAVTCKACFLKCDRGRWGNMGTLRNSVHHRLSNDKKVLLLVLKETLDICLSIADLVFWQGLAIYFSEMLE